MSKKQKLSAYLNHRDWGNWFTRIYNIALSAIEWVNCPESIDPRFIEQTLFWQGRAVWFKDEVIGHMCLPIVQTSLFDWYGNLVECKGRSYNYISDRLYCSKWAVDKTEQKQNAVIIYNNTARLPDLDIVAAFAQRLSELDRTIDVNINAQKTPVLITCEESERLTMKGVYEEYQGNEPVIYGTKNVVPNMITSINTKADFVGAELFALRKLILQDCMSYLGIESNISEKSERVLSGEISANMGPIESYRESRLFPRQQAVDEINKIFNTNIEVRYRSELDLSKIMEGRTMEEEGGEQVGLARQLRHPTPYNPAV